MKHIFTKRNLLIAIAVVVVAGGVALFLNKSSDNGTDNMAEATGQIWTCSMHPQVRLPKPGKCPICSMPLILAMPAAKHATTNGMTNATAAASDLMLELSDHARAMASVETVRSEEHTSELQSQ